MRILNFIMMILFLISCAVQYNDPDPIRWIAVYGIAAVLSGMAMFDKYTAWPILPGLVYLGVFIYLCPRELGPWLEIETARESGGMLLSLVWMIVLTAVWYGRRGKTSGTLSTGS